MIPTPEVIKEYETKRKALEEKLKSAKADLLELRTLAQKPGFEGLVTWLQIASSSLESAASDVYEAIWLD